LAYWTGYAAAELKPIWTLMRQELLTSTKLFVDETIAPVLDPGRGRTKTGYFWAIARDDRAWAGPDPPAVVYTYALAGAPSMRSPCWKTQRRAADRRL